MTEEAADRQKAAAKRRFLAAGGTEAQFDKDYPAIRRQMAADAAARNTDRELQEARNWMRRNA